MGFSVKITKNENLNLEQEKFIVEMADYIIKTRPKNVAETLKEAIMDKWGGTCDVIGPYDKGMNFSVSIPDLKKYVKLELEDGRKIIIQHYKCKRKK